MAVQLRIFTEPQQGASYDDLLQMARCAEDEGFDAFFRSDHYLKMGSASGLPGPTDAWITLAGLARETSTIRLGTLVTSATFRHVGPLAVSVAQVDQMSGGRVELGIGAGWYGEEHEASGIPFPPLKERFERLEDQLAILTGLWGDTSGSFTHVGRHLEVRENPGLPKPSQRPRPPIIVGGMGPSTTPRLAATYADEFNTPFLQPADAATQFGRVRAACEAIDRDPTSLVSSSALVVCCGEDEATIERRAAAMGWTVENLRAFGACGSPDEVATRLGQWIEAGASRLYLQILDLADLDHVRLIARSVAPLLS